MLQSILASAVLLASICGQANGLSLPFKAVPEEALAAEGLTTPTLHLIAAKPNGGPLLQAGLTITADSENAGFPITNTLDGLNTTYFHSQYKPTTIALPHTITIDTGSTNPVNGMTYLPRQDGSKNGNIGQHKIYISTDGVNFGNPVAFGTWYDDHLEKSAAWETQPARYIRLVAITEAGGRGPWTSASEFNVYVASAFTTPVSGAGSWGPTINFPLVPVAAAIEVDTGNVLVWSSWASNNQYNNPGKGQTLTALYNPTTGIVTQRTVTETQHDMFCPGLSFDAQGHIFVTGGNSNKRTSIFSVGTNSWANGTQMNIGRGYHAHVTLGDGRIFTIGGSWSGGVGNKNGESYDPKTQLWTKLPQCPVAPMLTADKGGVFRQDNHGWLFNWKNGTVLQAGPAKQMNWYTTTGTGGVLAAGLRGLDTDSMCGDATMYDAVAGKILTVGGSPSYQNTNATANAHIMTLGAANTTVAVETIGPMSFQRVFGSSVVLPDGQVFVTGGQVYGVPYNEDTSIFTSEIWNPTTKNFTQTIPNSTPRVYHSFALLMRDATVMVGGGGLCNTCSTNHFDAQVFTPPYLLNADGSLKTRPVIKSISARSNKPGAVITVVTGGPVLNFSLIRHASATHTVNTDQRRVAIVATPSVGTNTYKITLGVADYGVVTPGYWMLFAISTTGVPSIATTVYIV